MNNDLPPIPCPVCDGCDHDLRSGVLELAENISANVRSASEALIDAMETSGPASLEFIEAQSAFLGVKAQITAVLEIIPDIAMIKAANA
jgi:hypothetical protein